MKSDPFPNHLCINNCKGMMKVYNSSSTAGCLSKEPSPNPNHLSTMPSWVPRSHNPYDVAKNYTVDDTLKMENICAASPRNLALNLTICKILPSWDH